MTPNEAGRTHPGVPLPGAGKPESRTVTVITVLLASLILLTLAVGYWMTGGTIVSPSDSATMPPSLRNQPEKEYMLGLINEARAEAGVLPVTMGSNQAAQIHADQMLEECFVSHWGIDGLKPYMRYSLSGGYQVNGENVTTTNECGLLDTWTQWNSHPEAMVEEAMAGLLASEEHRETMLSPHYRKVSIGLAWDRHVFKAAQVFEGDYVELPSPPEITDGELVIEGKLAESYDFQDDVVYPLEVIILYDHPPRTLTNGQLLHTKCLRYGAIVAKIISPHPLFTGSYRDTETVEVPACTDPQEAGEIARRPSTKAEMAEAWAEGRKRAEQVEETRFRHRAMQATEVKVEGREFSFKADVGEVLDQHGPGVYTVLLMATLEGVGEERTRHVIAQRAIFQEVGAPSGYGQAE